MLWFDPMERQWFTISIMTTSKHSKLRATWPFYAAFLIGVTLILTGMISAWGMTPVASTTTPSPDSSACASRLATNPSVPEHVKRWLLDCVEAMNLPTAAPTVQPSEGVPPTLEPTAGPTVVPTTIAPTATPEPTPLPTPLPTLPPVTPPTSPAFPTFAGSGYTGAASLLTTAGCSISANNIVLDHKRFNCTAGALQIYGINVKITNSVVNVFAGTWGGVQVYGSAVIEDTTIQAGEEANPWARETAVGGHDFTLTRVRILGGGDGVDVEGDNITVQDSYIEIRPTAGGHSDGVQLASGGANVKLLRNTIILTTPSTSPLFWSGAAGPAVVIEGNLLSGGPYSLRIGGNSGAGAIVKDNVVARNSWGPDGGPYFVESPCTAAHDIHWSGNRLGDVTRTESAISVTGLTNLVVACN